MNIGFISCAKTKKVGYHPAGKLYDSTFFRAAFAYASRRCKKVFILSAKHGLLLPDERIRDYDFSLYGMAPREHERWAERAYARTKNILSPDDTLYFFCGSLYREPLMTLLSKTHTCHAPLEGLSIGQQLKWYKEHTPAS